MLAEALKAFPKSTHPDLLVGFNHADDAGVYRISADTALVQTVDFFPPIVDDPYYFGQIAAANALSDVYAMGGRPITALNIVGFPSGLPASILTDILRGGADKVSEAGAVVVGGHSVKDQELKYGVAVTGLIHPDKIVTNDGARAGDVLYLTKPLGTGIITTGIKKGMVDDALVERVVAQMAMLNRDAAELMLAVGAHAATDITGFGLLGHAHEMAAASGVTIRINAAALPILPQAIDLGGAGAIPGGLKSNEAYLEDKCRIADSVDAPVRPLLFDPQTSGGLFIAVPSAQTDRLEQLAKDRNLFIAKIGTVEPAGEIPLLVD